MSHVHGWVNLHKPPGLATRALANAVLSLLRNKARVGHAGTLDPFASGVVPVAVGAATRLIRFLPDTKEYVATLKLGLSTTTGDTTRTVTERRPVAVSVDNVRKVAASLCGTQLQVPPTVSAVKINGERAYRVALRDGIKSFTLAPRMVTVHSIRVGASACGGALSERRPTQSWLRRSAIAAAPSPVLGAVAGPERLLSPIQCAYPEMQLTVRCAGGVYVRSIATSMGALLEMPACLADLRRTESNGFLDHDSVNVHDVRRGGVPALTTALIPLDSPFARLPAVVALPTASTDGDRGDLDAGLQVRRPRTGPSRPMLSPSAYARVRRTTVAAVSCATLPEAAATATTTDVEVGKEAPHDSYPEHTKLMSMCPAESALFTAMWKDDTRTCHAAVVVETGDVGAGYITADDGDAEVGSGSDAPLRLRLVRVYALLAATTTDDGARATLGAASRAVATLPDGAVPGSRLVFCGLAVVVPASLLPEAPSIHFRGGSARVPHSGAAASTRCALVVVSRVVSVLE